MISLEYDRIKVQVTVNLINCFLNNLLENLLNRQTVWSDHYFRRSGFMTHAPGFCRQPLQRTLGKYSFVDDFICELMYKMFTIAKYGRFVEES